MSVLRPVAHEKDFVQLVPVNLHALAKSRVPVRGQGHQKFPVLLRSTAAVVFDAGTKTKRNERNNVKAYRVRDITGGGGGIVARTHAIYKNLYPLFFLFLVMLGSYYYSPVNVRSLHR